MSEPEGRLGVVTLSVVLSLGRQKESDAGKPKAQRKEDKLRSV